MRDRRDYGPSLGWEIVAVSDYRKLGLPIPPVLKWVPVRKEKPPPCPLPSRGITIGLSHKWRAKFPTLAHARNDPKTFWMAADFACDLLNCSRQTLESRYLRTGRLPYMVRRWSRGVRGHPASKVFVPRAVVQELAVALVMDHRRKVSNQSKQKLGVLKGLDAISRRLYPDAPVITTHTRREPVFVNKKPEWMTQQGGDELLDRVMRSYPRPPTMKRIQDPCVTPTEPKSQLIGHGQKSSG